MKILFEDRDRSSIIKIYNQLKYMIDRTKSSNDPAMKNEADNARRRMDEMDQKYSWLKDEASKEQSQQQSSSRSGRSRSQSNWQNDFNRQYDDINKNTREQRRKYEESKERIRKLENTINFIEIAVVLVPILIQIGYNIYKFYKNRGSVKCLFIIHPLRRKLCYLKSDLLAKTKELEILQTSKKLCDTKSKDPEKCKRMIQKRIDQVESNIKKLQTEISTLERKIK